MADRIVLEDIEEQVDVVPGGVDLGDQSVDDHVGVGHQRDGVAANDRQAAAMLGQLGQHAVLIGFAKRNDVRFRRGILGSLKQRPKLLTRGPIAAGPSGFRQSADTAPVQSRARKR